MSLDTHRFSPFETHESSKYNDEDQTSNEPAHNGYDAAAVAT